MAENIELIMRFHPAGGQDFAILSRDFTGEQAALQAVAQALDERRSLVLARARYDRDTADNGVVINLTNVVSVRVASTDSATSGQYL